MNMQLRHNCCLRAVVVTKAERSREGPLSSREASELGKVRETPFFFFSQTPFHCAAKNGPLY